MIQHAQGLKLDLAIYLRGLSCERITGPGSSLAAHLAYKMIESQQRKGFDVIFTPALIVCRSDDRIL